MKFPLSQLSSTGASLVDISSRMQSLANEASEINSSIASCYGQGGVGGRVGTVSSSMYNQASTISHLGRVASDAAKSYTNAEDNICTFVYSRSGETYIPKPEKIHVYGNAIEKGAAIVFSRVKEFASNVRTAYENAYNEHGALYDAVEYGKCARRVGKGVVKIVGAAAAFSTGVGIPISLVEIISAGNDMVNAFNDAAYIYTDQYEEVGKTNVLKDALVSGYGNLGEMLGNQEAGELFGELTYTGIDLISFLDGADKMLSSYGKVNTDITGPRNSFVWGEAQWDDVIDSEYEHLDVVSFLTDTKTFAGEYFRKNVLKIDPGSTGHFITEAAKNTISTYKKGTELAENALDILLK